MLIVNQIKLHLDEDEKNLKERLIKKLNLKNNDLISYEIYSKAIDARKEVLFVYSLKVKLKNEDKYLNKKDVSVYKPYKVLKLDKPSDIRPIIIGYGPSGIFSAISLIDAGIKPIIFERGSRINKRKEDVYKFFNYGILDTSSNVQYGEGGAGTFSDAKLTTRVKDPYIEYITDKFIEYGANKDIKYESHPHIGTDEIQKIITNLTNDLINKGASFHFDEEIKDFIIEDGQIKGVISDLNTYYSDYVILACGHSAYDTIKTLNKYGVYMENKDFSVGFRVEHPQVLIDKNQYGDLAFHPKLKTAEYFLRSKTQDNKGVYSFCMCPGGYVVASSSDKNSIVTNGMSYADRGNKYANSAILVQIDKSDFGDELFAGFDYIHNLESKAYKISNSYQALSQNIKDYMNNELNDLIMESSYSLGTKLYDFNKFFDKKLNNAFKEAFLNFDKKIEGFIDKGIMVGPETRSSCPIRIKRNINLESVNTHGLYPCGEGAGYAGGIMSSALDGIRIAHKIINTLD